MSTHATGAMFEIVLHEPEIPNNTGNIGRTCVATGCGLHLIKPLGFDTSEKACRRAGLDYWPRLRPKEHESWAAYRASSPKARVWMFTTKAARAVWDVRLERGDHLVFGKETRGLPEELLREFDGKLVTLPMVPDERSLNLATAVCAAVYEGARQLVTRGEIEMDERGRLHLERGLRAEQAGD